MRSETTWREWAEIAGSAACIAVILLTILLVG